MKAINKNNHSLPLVFLIRKLIANTFLKIDNFFGLNNDILAVLCFHGFSNKEDRYSLDLGAFEKHIQKIKHFYDFAGLDIVEKILNGYKANRAEVLITIDDGYKDAMQILPISKKYRIPIVLFVLSSPKNVDRKELGNNQGLLSWEQIKYLKQQGWTIGCHSATHINFKNLTSKQIIEEVITAKNNLQKRLGFEVKAFAYPKGYYNKKIKEAVEKAGFEFAFSIDAGVITSNSDRFILPRTIIDNTHSFSEIPGIYTKSWLQFRKLTNRLGLWEKFLT